MTQITTDRIFELIEKSRLVEPNVLRVEFEKIRAANDGHLPDDPVALCKLLEDAGLVTRWQCEKLLQGKYKGFFLGKHKLLGHLGSGGMSSVYLAEHTGMKHRRAIKVLPKSKLGNNSYLQRFQLEAKAIASLNHPNIVQAFDIDHEKDTHYLVMEYVEGADMQNLVRKHGPLPFAVVADYIAQAARGLHHAHEAGLIHRDVKPANLLINKDGFVKVLDLGLALFSEDVDSSLTMEYNDKVLGTADYLPPEQAINSHKIDSRADMYGLGCTMYFLLTGHPPFPDGSIPSRIIKHQNEMPPDIRIDRPDCPGELDGICVKMMQKDPRFRYASCEQVAEVLESWLVKYRESIRNNPARSSEANLAVTDILEGRIKSQANVDTVTNRGSGTMGGKVPLGSAIVSLSTSDSGVLRAIAKSDGSTIDSKIDLVHDTSAPNPRKSKSNAIAKATTSLTPGPPSQQNSASPLTKSPLVKPLEKQTASGTKPKSIPSKTHSKPANKSNTIILVVAGVIMTLLFVGILIAILANR